MTDGFFMRYNYGMRKFNFFTWMISYYGKPLSYRLWVMIAFTLLFIMWLCVQFVFTQLLGQYFLYFVLPCTLVGLAGTRQSIFIISISALSTKTAV